MSATDSMTTREIYEYLAKQQARHWPGSYSIHPYVERLVPNPERVPRDSDGAYRLFRRLDGRCIVSRVTA